MKKMSRFIRIVFVASVLFFGAALPFSASTQTFIGSSQIQPQFIGSSGGSFIGSSQIHPNFIGSGSSGSFIGSSQNTPYFIGSSQVQPQFIGSSGGSFIGSRQVQPNFIGSTLVPPQVQPPTCPAGYTYNSSNNTCVGPAPSIQNPTCPSGYSYNASNNTCVGSAPSYTNYPYYSNYYPRFLGGSYYSGYSYPNYYGASYSYQPQYVGVAGFAYPQTQVVYQQPQVTTVSVPAPQVVVQKAEPLIQTAVASALQILEVAINTDSIGNTIVAFTTNQPAYGEVVFGKTSQNGLSGSYNYDFTTGVISNLFTDHEVNLGKLDFSQVYYLRAVARNGGGQDISEEIAYIPVPAGEGLVPRTQPDGLASIFGIGLSGMNLVFLVLILIIFLLSLYLVIRSHRKTNIV